MRKIHFVIDLSASMHTMIEDVKVSICETIDNLGECDISISTFNDVLNINASSATSSTFSMPELYCQGKTRLYDCLKEVLTLEIESQQTVIVILTDGINNLGNTSEQEVRNMITKFKENNNVVKFLGANMDALTNASILGVDANDALTYDGINVKNAFRALSSNICEFQKSGVNVPFLKPQRLSSIQAPNNNFPKVTRCKSTRF